MVVFNLQKYELVLFNFPLNVFVCTISYGYFILEGTYQYVLLQTIRPSLETASYTKDPYGNLQ